MNAYDHYGIRHFDEVPHEALDMFSPVRCSYCSGVYDLGRVEVTARYVDCSMWKAPCCGVTVDDRGDTGWKSRKDYTRLNRSGT